MKKFTLSIMMLALSCSLFAQRIELPAPSGTGSPFLAPNTGMTYGLPTMPSNAQNNGLNKLTQFTAWYDFVNSFSLAQQNGGFDLTNKRYNLTMFPDTAQKIIYVNTTTNAADPEYNNWCSFGTCFDPTDSIYDLDGDTVNTVFHAPTIYTSAPSYTVDSVAYFYIYSRHTDSTVVDTLIFQAAKLSTYYVARVSGNITSGQGTVGYDTKNGIASGMDLTVKIPLTVKDTSTRFFKTFQRNLGITCNTSKGEYIATTLTFKPGNSYVANDTIIDYYGPDTTAHLPTKKFNTFGLLVDEDDNGTQNLSHRPNNGLVVNKQQRYLATWFLNKALGPMYMFFSGFGSTGNITFYPRTNYKVTGYTGTGIADALKNGYGLGDIYPNPVVNGNATIDFAMGKTANATIQISDILGRKLMTVASGMFTTGTHNLSISTQGLKPGVYFYTINTNGFTQTKKFTIAQ